MKHVLVLFLAIVAVHVPQARCEPPANADELLRLVPGDYGFCLVVQDLKTHVEKWVQSPLAKKLARSPLLKAILDDPAFQAMAKGKGDLAKILGITEQELLDDVL